MTKTTKSVLLSALVFPGAGYFILKKPLYGSICLGLVGISMVLIAQYVMQIAQPIADQMSSGAVPIDPVLMQSMVQQSLQQTDSFLVSFSSYLVLVLWIGSSGHAYYLGKQQEGV